MYYLVWWFIFFFNDTATTEIYTLSLHDALPISGARQRVGCADRVAPGRGRGGESTLRRARARPGASQRSEEHTSELQSQSNLVCRLLLEKKKKTTAQVTSRAIHLSPDIRLAVTR